MEKKWDGKTKGSVWGYKFFIFCIQVFGLSVAYFFCYFISFSYFLFARKNRKGLLQFYQIGFGFSYPKALYYTYRNFNCFGQILIDRVAFQTFRKKQFSYEVVHEQTLIDMANGDNGGLLLSSHLGNWESAGNLIGERVTAKINILMLDEEVEKIKHLLEEITEGPRYRLIPLKNDMSHLIEMHKVLSNKELVALHADRTMPGHKTYQIPFLNGIAEFPAGPFLLAHKFKVPLAFVFAVKEGWWHYKLLATESITNFDDPEQLAKMYVAEIERLVKQYPTQWFNFYEYYVDRKK